MPDRRTARVVLLVLLAGLAVRAAASLAFIPAWEAGMGVPPAPDSYPDLARSLLETGTLGFPAFLAVIALVTEITAPVALVLGLGGRVAALGVIGLMLGAASTHLSNGFFMNWFGTLPAGSEGFEYHLLVLALAGIVALGGSGAWSLDRLLQRDRPAGSSASPLRAAA